MGGGGGGRGVADVCPLMHKKTSHAHFRLLLPSNDITCFSVKNFQLKNLCYYSFVISLFLKTETTFFLFLRGKLSSSIKRRQKGASAGRVRRLWLVRGKTVARSLSNNDGDGYESVT